MRGYLISYVVETLSEPCGAAYCVARIPGLDYSSAVGTSREGAIDNLRLIAKDWILLREHLGIDLPRSVAIELVIGRNANQPEPKDKIFIPA